MSGKNDTMSAGGGGRMAFELSPPPMIGLLPATTVVYILLGFGALLPVVLLSVVAVTLCARRRGRGSTSEGVTPVDLGLDGRHHSNPAARFDFDLDDDDHVDDVFWPETWRPPSSDRGRDGRKRTPPEVGAGKAAEIHSADNPNVYFRNRIARRTQSSDGESRVSSSDVVVTDRAEKPSASGSYRNGEPPTTLPTGCDVTPCDVTSGRDVTPTSFDESDVGDDATSTNRMSRDVPASAVSSLDRLQPTTKTSLQQEEEQVLRLLDEVNCTLETDLLRSERNSTLDNVLQAIHVPPLVTHL